MRIIRNNCINENIVKCKKCNSIFTYNEDDIINNWVTCEIICPCCHTKGALWEFDDIDKEELFEEIKLLIQEETKR